MDTVREERERNNLLHGSRKRKIIEGRILLYFGRMQKVDGRKIYVIDLKVETVERCGVFWLQSKRNASNVCE